MIIHHKRNKVKQIFTETQMGSKLCVKGWVRNKRSSKNIVFISLNDGSTINNLQLVIDGVDISSDILKQINTGACIVAFGILSDSQGSGQSVELKVISLEILGTADPEEYPLQPKKHSLEFLREIAHLRPRTNTFSAILRIRNALTFSVHSFFQQRGFFNIHTPIITASDAEGAGETFHVSTLDFNNIPKNPENEVNYKKDFFEKETKLTVSGQLEGELAALALSEIYTFGPTFRAENSNTTRHLAEFWMIEPEMAFYDLNDNMELAESMLKFIIQYALENCKEDLEFLNKRALDEEKTKPLHQRNELSLIDSLEFIINNEFKRISYTDAIEILKKSKPNQKKKFQYLITEWGIDLQSEHERFLVEKHFKKPVIIYNYPKKIKAFYMRQNDDGKTVAAMDVLFPGIGEIVGGSQREEREGKLRKRMEEMNVPKDELWWYLDTRKFGTAPHSGFGLGFERMVQFVTRMGNIRDVIPFPRTPGNCEF